MPTIKLLFKRRPNWYGFSGVLLIFGLLITLKVFYNGSTNSSTENGHQITGDGKPPKVAPQDRLAKSTLPSKSPQGGGGDKKSITPGEAEILLVEARANPDVMARSAACINIIKRLCLAGYSSEAWGLIDENPGQVRNSELAKFFESAGLSAEELTDKLENLPYRGETSTALRGYFSSLDSNQVSELMQDPVFKSLIKKLDIASPGILKRTLASYLMMRVAFSGNPSERTQTMESAVGYYSQGLIDDDGFTQVLKNDASKNAFEKFELIASTLKTITNSNHAVEVRKDIVNAMVDSDAPKALSLIMQVTGDVGTMDLFFGLMKWGGIDSNSANHWFLENRSKLTDPQRDAAATAFYQMALDYHEPEGAEQWANLIVDPKLKKQALSKLPKSEKSSE